MCWREHVRAADRSSYAQALCRVCSQNTLAVPLACLAPPFSNIVLRRLLVDRTHRPRILGRRYHGWHYRDLGVFDRRNACQRAKMRRPRFPFSPLFSHFEPKGCLLDSFSVKGDKRKPRAAYSRRLFARLKY